MEIDEISIKLQQVIEIYSNKFSIEKTEDWFVLKMQEELGELVSAHLKLSKRGRTTEEEKNLLGQNLEEEVADVLAMTLLFARMKGINVEQAIINKWFKYL